MSQDTSDPRCPECGGPIGATATYCMHCSADLTDQRASADLDGDGFWDARTTAGGAAEAPSATDTDPPVDPESGPAGRSDGRLLDPDGIVDDSLTAVVGIAGGLVVGVVGTAVLMLATGSGWAGVVGLLAWIAATVHLVRRPTVADAVARTAYGVAIVLLLVPLIAFGPTETETELGARVVLFAAMLGGLAIPAAVLAGIGYVVSRVFGGDGR